jgi:N-methylhydantoinase A
LNQQEAGAIVQYEKEGVNEESVLFSRFVDLRYVGQEHTVKVPVPNGMINKENMQQVIEKFHETHEQLFTFKLDESPTEIVNLHLIALGSVKKPELAKLENSGRTLQDALKEVRPVLYEEHGWIDTKVYDREKLSPAAVFEGPAIVEEQSASTVVYPGQSIAVDVYGNLIIETGV